MRTLTSDLRYGIRLLLKSPIFALTAILALALGIGANTAIFSAVDTVLIRPLPYADPDRLAMVWEDGSYIGFPQNTPAPANYVDWRKQNQVFTDLAAMRGRISGLTGEGAPEFLYGRGVTSNFFGVLGVPALLGRTLDDQDDHSGVRTVVISYGLWQRRFGGDRGIINRPILLDGEKYNVVGVMPRGFHFPDRRTDIWASALFTPEDLARRGSHFLQVFGRLKPGVSMERAQSDMTTIAKRLEHDYPETNTHIGVTVVPMRDQAVKGSRTSLIVLLIGAGCVLLIACANVANLLLARAAGREREMAVRTALGAGRLRLIRQMVTESVVLSLIGGALGLVIARLGIRLLTNLVPTSMDAKLTIDPTVLLFTAVISILTGVLFGVIPALQASRLDLNDALKQGGRANAGGRKRLLRDALVVAEVALALVLLVGAGLMIQTLFRLKAVDVGFRAGNLLTMRTRLGSSKYNEPANRQHYFDGVVERVRALPGVVSAGMVSNLPFRTIGNTNGFKIEGRPAPPNGNSQDALFRGATTDYLATLGVRLLDGRLFNNDDRAGTTPVVIINQTFAKQYWSGESPIGKRIDLEYGWWTIIGVVEDVRERGLDVPLKAGVYYLSSQNPTAWAIPMDIVIRTSTAPLNLAPAVREVIWSLDRDLPITDVRTMEDLMDEDVASRRQQMMLLGAFAALALLLASVGIYGVLSYTVTQRSREIGLRMALGASRSEVVGMILRYGLTLTAAGLAIGGAGAFALGQAMQKMLYDIKPSDPATFGAVVTLLSAVAITACVIPATRASKLDPMIALRDE